MVPSSLLKAAKGGLQYGMVPRGTNNPTVCFRSEEECSVTRMKDEDDKANDEEIVRLSRSRL